MAVTQLVKRMLDAIINASARNRSRATARSGFSSRHSSPVASEIIETRAATLPRLTGRVPPARMVDHMGRDPTPAHHRKLPIPMAPHPRRMRPEAFQARTVQTVAAAAAATTPG